MDTGETRRAEMEAFDWRLHEPLRQVKEWLAANPGINADLVEIARWCQEVPPSCRQATGVTTSLRR